MKLNRTMTEKQKKWRQTRLRVNRIIDCLGKKTDRKVRETITALQVLGFNTNGSCAGHLGDLTWGMAAPWIDIGKNIPKSLIRGNRIRKDRKALKELKVFKENNFKEQARLMQLFDEFYQNRNVPYDVRLTLNMRGIYGNARLVSGGALIQEVRSRKERREKLIEYRQQMDAFTDFLKKKYFTDNPIKP